MKDKANLNRIIVNVDCFINTMEKIYKYAPLDKAIKILKDDRLLLKNPSSFNDPFDTNIKRDLDDIQLVREICKGFVTMTVLIRPTLEPKIAAFTKNHPLFKKAQQEYQAIVKQLREQPYFYGNNTFTALFEILKFDKNKIKAEVEKTVAIFEETIAEEAEKTKKKALATCFSKTYESILMWSHYANSHEGVCIEYERPDSHDFVDIVYKLERPKLKLAKLVAFATAKTILGEDYNTQISKHLINLTMEPYLTKSIQWQYEQEVRCLITTTSHSKNYVCENDLHYYKMPKPTKIFIGCKCTGKELDELIEIAKKKKIECKFLKEDSDMFLLREK